METKQYEVHIKLIDNQSFCHSGHKIGDEWVFDYMTPGGICSLAYNAKYPTALTLQFGKTFPWKKDQDIITVAYPDGQVNNIFELRRKLKT